ncbi:DNA topoisomerase (ATP-hydrolyzing) subunit B [Anaerofustis sp.]|uniref:DNA topoisomerase (ATP-hydrolyzing) subunit B n=1 Tax=Anaerofustis sp. TaxID=1872517 RepID=UPI0025C639C2|nr:DNA topoisomerase (ATP-hydrolyzing) subunit B [Anaerofustis sp.]
MAKQDNNNYDASKIKVLEGLEAVRKRPGMYIGSTGEKGLHHLVYEIVDNSVDEALAGFCKNIFVTIGEGDTITVLDDGRGIPTGMNPKYKKSAVEIALTILHAGGKFDSGTYKVSGGLHGVGVSVVNALSEHLTVTVYQNEKIHQQKYERGKPLTPLEVIGKTKKTGTEVFFKPDSEIFSELVFNYDTLKHRIRELAFLNKGLNITLKDEREGKEQEESFHYEGGITEFVEYANRGKEKLTPEMIYFEKESDVCMLEVAMQYTTSFSESIYSFANNINTVEGGMHVNGFKTALTRSINAYARKYNILKDNEENLSGDDIREGLCVVISVKISDPEFEGQTKTKLGNPEVRGYVDTAVGDNISSYLEEHPPVAKTIVEKALTAQRARKAARKAKDLVRRKSVLESTALPGKLADCREKDPSKCEIYIVEGDSAGGSAKLGRNPKTQAILPLRGKILNVEKARLDRILNTDTIRSMITAFGTGISEEFDIEKARYHKIVIMTDADVDGAHIRTLLLTFFYRYMRGLLDAGYVYIAQPPLYKLEKQKKVWYLYSDEELETKLQEIGRDKIGLQRYKGLGEMNGEQLWDTTMNPENRTLLQVSIDDAAYADEIFSILMGDQVQPRKDFITENARKVQNLDI